MKTFIIPFALLSFAALSFAPLASQNAGLLPGCAADTPANAPVAPSDEELIKNVIRQFMRGGDESDTSLLSGVLHPQFRVIVNQGVLGAESLRVVERPAYLQQIAARKWGGVPRSVEIVSLSVAHTVAAAEVKTSSVRSDITSFLHLVKGKDGNWMLIGDTPYPVPKKGN